MSDLICRKTMRACQTPGMCSPWGGCMPPLEYDRLATWLGLFIGTGLELKITPAEMLHALTPKRLAAIIKVMQDEPTAPQAAEPSATSAEVRRSLSAGEAGAFPSFSPEAIEVGAQVLRESGLLALETSAVPLVVREILDAVMTAQRSLETKGVDA